jgi:glycosyltransferase involved in cell wall biosynthesis
MENLTLTPDALPKQSRPGAIPSSLCVNLRTLGYGITGVQRYLLSLLPYLPKDLPSVKPSRALQGIKGHLWEQFYLPALAKGRLLWSPGNTGPLAVSRQVLTLHDASSLDHPEWFERKFALWYNALLPRLVRKVRAIITVSEFSKERIVALTKVEPGSVHVVLNGVEPRFCPQSPEVVADVMDRYELRSPYILYVGSLEPRKNLKMLLEAWGLGRFDGATLAVVGASGHLFANQDLGSLPEGVRLLGRLGDEDLPALYSGAAGFVFPSVYEGFGLPPLEALACACPVAASDIPVHREVLGDHALYFDPFSPEALQTSLESLVSQSPANRAARVQPGLEQAARFSWERAANQTWAILQSVS